MSAVQLYSTGNYGSGGGGGGRGRGGGGRHLLNARPVKVGQACFQVSALNLAYESRNQSFSHIKMKNNDILDLPLRKTLYWNSVNLINHLKQVERKNVPASPQRKGVTVRAVFWGCGCFFWVHVHVSMKCVNTGCPFIQHSFIAAMSHHSVQDDELNTVHMVWIQFNSLTLIFNTSLQQQSSQGVEKSYKTIPKTCKINDYCRPIQKIYLDMEWHVPPAQKYCRWVLLSQCRPSWNCSCQLEHPTHCKRTQAHVNNAKLHKQTI